MKFDSAKSFPHPVLRPRSTDYERVEFQVEVEVERLEGTTGVRVGAVFTMSDPDLLSLVEREAARYSLVLRCPVTNFRQDLSSSTPRVEREFSHGELAGELEITPFCVAARPIPAFRAVSWNADYDGLEFDLHEGAVLAMDDSVRHWIDTADDGHIGTIFKLVEYQEAKRGQWSCEPTDERVEIRMHPEDYRRFLEARGRVGSSSDGYYLMNGVYLPALLYLLEVVDADPDEHESKRWYASLEARLEKLNCEPIGSGSAERLKDAQAILENPFRGLPLLAGE